MVVASYRATDYFASVSFMFSLYFVFLQLPFIKSPLKYIESARQGIEMIAEARALIVLVTVHY